MRLPRCRGLNLYGGGEDSRMVGNFHISIFIRFFWRVPMFARLSQLVTWSAPQIVRIHRDGDVLAWVALFALTGLLISLVAAMLGLPQIVD
jgi:hypothetical protein